MMTILIILAMVLIGLPILALVFKLVFGFFALILGLVSLPIILVGFVIFIPLLILGLIFGFALRLIPFLLLGGLGYFFYQRYKNREFY